jgi:hypothetical protein
VGHLIQYFTSVPEPMVRSWLARQSGFYCHEPDDGLKRWEGEMGSGETFWANVAPHTCNFALCMKYTGLYIQQAPAVEFARRFAREFWRYCGPIPLLRVDEFLVGQWCREVGRDWETFEQPVEEFLSWLNANDDHDDHWHLLTAFSEETKSGELQSRDGV